MWLAILAVVVGLAILVWSADVFIDGAVALANKLNVPSFLIGVIILGLGTSAPEMIVSMLAALEGSPELALGNAYGSNIVNIALVLGATVLISPIIIRKSIINRDMPLLLLVTAVAAWQLSDGVLSNTDGIVLIVLLVVVLGIQIILSLREGNHEHEGDTVEETAKAEHSMAQGLGRLFLGLLVLILSSRAIVWGAIELATLWGLSELIIGLTIVAIGTSLPELVASLSAARKGEHDMALGNIIGSNVFNTLGVVGVAALIAPITPSSIILSRDILAMGLLTLLLFAMCLFAFKTKRAFGRTSGTTLVLFFVGYTVWLIQTVSM
ncbi:calcium/sodium antiporter [Psychrobacter faecalis]|jgi:cation:H+ antiporter|uniref:Calcium/sodium antiporter n=2 Tax=Psychrobacter TaxID=497 RepID=A0ABW1W5F9_9GAMM|nr:MULTISPECIES: calcium/sodium antiporter [Psychrobacter]MBO6225256.1 calcium/sodium antiporter [Psychrobacter sp.]MCG3861372.1 calcium/sodium antiporter [Psychrobacter sp. Ps5]MDN3397225.1 calcium/sodium antiporter [Psychrobacter sp. APC 3426]OAP69667.1 calcium/sodium antiporter [Psychrobacter sp. SHUES1]WLW65728.1 calcium/sodium antiporter [Psychrobacter sp. van23A]